MKKLIHIVRGIPDRGMEFGLGDMTERLRRNPEAILSRKIDMQNGNFQKEVEFVLVNENEAAVVMQALAEANPGYEVRLYSCEEIVQCPAAEMVKKKISASGVLPG